MCLFRKMTFKEYVNEIYRQSALSYEQALIVGIYCWKEDLSVREAIRYAIAWHDHPEGGLAVCFDKPMKFSDAPMPKCEVKEE